MRLEKVAHHYKMGKQIGEGGCGKVFKVQTIEHRENFVLRAVVVPEGKSVDDVERGGHERVRLPVHLKVASFCWGRPEISLGV